MCSAGYIIPRFLIVLGFALTPSGHKLTERQEQVLKLLSGVMMLALGIILVVASEFLNNLIGAGVVLGAALAGTALIVLVHRSLGQDHSPTAFQPRVSVPAS